MALTLKRGRVSAVVERHEGLVRVEVDGTACVAYPQLTGPVAVDDDVLVNTQARELGLGSGGFDVLYVNLTRGVGLPVEHGAHVMKLPYTPSQFAVRHVEEEAPLMPRLDGMPVVCCSLHSQLAPVCAALDGSRVAYLQLAGGALPVMLSDAVRVLRQRGLLAAAVGVGPCFGGDVDCVSVYSGLAWAKADGADVAVCGIGPGVVGTGSVFGHGGMAAAEAATAAAGLGGDAIVVARLSERDPRPSHRGLSHHTVEILSLRGVTAALAWPAGAPIEPPPGAEIVDAGGWRRACAELPLSHMGRGPDEDPWFFAAAFAAGRLARQTIS